MGAAVQLDLMQGTRARARAQRRAQGRPDGTPDDGPATRPSRPSRARPGPGRAPVPAAALDLLAVAHRGLVDAELATTPAERYVAAHVAALRAGAAVLAARARPASTRRRPASVWSLLSGVAPELAEWAAFFAAGAGTRAAAEAGLDHALTTRQADDLVREAATFLALVESTLGVGPRPLMMRA